MLTPFRDRYDALLSRWVFAALDAAATAGIGAARNGSADAQPSARQSRYGRTQRAVRRLSRWVPGGYQALHARLIAGARLPLGVREVRLIGYGSAVTVFLLGAAPGTDRRRPLVLKVCRETLGRRLGLLAADARRRRGTYQRVAGWYDEASPLLPTFFVIAHCPLLSLAAVACVQPYVEGPHRDVFAGLRETELVDLATRGPRLRRQLASFAGRTARAVEREDACVDLVGRDNLIVAGPPAEPRLVLVDHGVHDLRKARAGRWLAEETARRLAYLQAVARRAERSTGNAGKEIAGVEPGR